MLLGLSHQLFNCDDVKMHFDKDSKSCDGICGMKMLKQKIQEKPGKIIRKPSGSSRNL